MEPVPDIHTMSTERMATTEAPDAQEIKARPLNISSMLRDYLDWLQHDLVQVDQNVIAGNTRTSIALCEVKVQTRHIWWALVAIAVLLLLNAALIGWMIYVLGVLIGHVR